jgi:hypothetical protein
MIDNHYIYDTSKIDASVVRKQALIKARTEKKPSTIHHHKFEYSCEGFKHEHINVKGEVTVV